jgi:hypothetical protein
MAADGSGLASVGKTADPHEPPANPELSRIVAAWPELPEPIRRAMMALIESSERCQVLPSEAKRT